MKRWLFVLTLAMALTAVPAAASTFLWMSPAEMIHDSGAVVLGKVLEVRSHWDEQGRVIVSEAVVQVDEAILGNPGSQIIVKTWGGTVDGYTVDAIGFPKFSANERVLLYLERERDGIAKVAGYQQGHFRVVMDASGFEYAVPTVEEGGHYIMANGQPAPKPKTLRLEDLKSSILGEARRAGRLEY